MPRWVESDEVGIDICETLTRNSLGFSRWFVVVYKTYIDLFWEAFVSFLSLTKCLFLCFTARAPLLTLHHGTWCFCTGCTSETVMRGCTQRAKHPYGSPRLQWWLFHGDVSPHRHAVSDCEAPRCLPNLPKHKRHCYTRSMRPRSESKAVLNFC